MRLFLRLPAIVVLFASPALAQEPAPPAKDDIPPPPAWAALKAAYEYNRRTLVVVKEKVRDDESRFARHITFKDPFGLEVTGLFTRPKAEGQYPCVLLLHGAGGSKENIMNSFGPQLVAKGIASLALDAAQHGERREQGSPNDPIRYKAGWVQRVSLIDYRIAIDWLKERKDIDGTHIGLIGYSMGSQMGAVLAGVDERIRAVLLCVGGDPIFPVRRTVEATQRENIDLVAPVNFIGHISPRPLLMLNGKEDDNIIPEMTKLLYDAAKEPREIRWTDSGHSLPREFLAEGINWLAGKLGVK
jgi:uncharacterized protein